MSLSDKLARLVRAQGPAPLSVYMAECNAHYYASRDPLGRAGDFTTAPEISQMFGELIGLWIADRWQAMGAPARFVLAELGPGRGTLMADALRAMRVLPGLIDAAELHLVETSPALRAEQGKRLTATFHNHIASLPDAPMILVANEFFDALPIRQYRHDGKGWREVLVGLNGDTFAPMLANGYSPIVPANALRHARGERNLGAVRAGPVEAPISDTIEICPAGLTIMAEIAARTARRRGAALVIDYGYADGHGDTFQALKNHQYADPFASPGEADLTAHVDFAALAQTAREAGATAHGPVAQGGFLRALGIGARAARLKQSRPDQAAAIDAALHRLTAPGEMGELFKVLAVTPDPAPPAGFV